MLDIQNKRNDRIVQYFEEVYKRDKKWTKDSGSEMKHEAFMSNYCITLFIKERDITLKFWIVIAIREFIVTDVLTLHSASISVESEVGKGTNFTIHLGAWKIYNNSGRNVK